MRNLNIKPWDGEIEGSIYMQGSRKGLQGKGYYCPIPNTFVLLKGSEVSAEEASYLNSKTKSMREELLQDKEFFIFKGDRYIVNQDFEFETPSSAGNFVTGTSINGRDYFKNKKRKSINDIFGSHKKQFGKNKT